jgi:aminopeptidase N
VTDDFERVCEREYGRPLGWFFKEWVYGTGQPGYQLKWEPAGEGQPGMTRVTIAQTSAGAFTMPLDVRIARAGGDTTVVVWDSLPVQRWDIGAGPEATDVVLDPGDWVLKAGEASH